ncbi:hypothetical protein J7K74_02785 [Candidatus Woesearchaeota archaeon]|nr:hypothetical protein [Candidatus Woesearchaeota archaeon]
MYEAIIIVKTKNAEKLKEFLEAEDQELANKRATQESVIGEDLVQVKIKAKDATSLRAMTNTIMKALSIWEKMEGIK